MPVQHCGMRGDDSERRRLRAGSGTGRSTPSYISSFGSFLKRDAADLSDRENSAGQSVARLPPRHDVRRGCAACLRSYISSGLPQMAFIRRSSGVVMPCVSAVLIDGLVPPAQQDDAGVG